MQINEKTYNKGKIWNGWNKNHTITNINIEENSEKIL